MATDVNVQSLIGTGPPASVNGQMAAMRWAKQNPPKEPKSSFVGKTVIITGSNTGIGLPVATKFAANGASKVILAVRNLSKGEEAKRSIVAETGCKAEVIDVLELDMSNWTSVKTFANDVTSRYDDIRIVALNAGVAPPSYVENEKTGYETGLQVNILSTAYLAMLLLPSLKSDASEGTPGQLAITGSFASKYVTPADAEVKSGQTLIDKLNDATAFQRREDVWIDRAGHAIHTTRPRRRLLQGRPRRYRRLHQCCMPGLLHHGSGERFPMVSRDANKIDANVCGTHSCTRSARVGQYYASGKDRLQSVLV